MATKQQHCLPAAAAAADAADVSMLDMNAAENRLNFRIGRNCRRTAYTHCRLSSPDAIKIQPFYVQIGWGFYCCSLQQISDGKWSTISGRPGTDLKIVINQSIALLPESDVVRSCRASFFFFLRFLPLSPLWLSLSLSLSFLCLFDWLSLAQIVPVASHFAPIKLGCKSSSKQTNILECFVKSFVRHFFFRFVLCFASQVQELR